MPRARKRAVEEEQAAQTPQEGAEPVKPAAASQPPAEPPTEPTQAPTGGGSIATVALTGEPALRLRALAEANHLSLAKLVVRMMEVFEAQTQ